MTQSHTCYLNQFITNATTNFSMDLSFLPFVPTEVTIKSITYFDVPIDRTLYLISNLITDTEGMLFPFTTSTNMLCDLKYDINEGQAPNFTVSVLTSDNEFVQFPANVGTLYSSISFLSVFTAPVNVNIGGVY